MWVTSGGEVRIKVFRQWLTEEKILLFDLWWAWKYFRANHEQYGSGLTHTPLYSSMGYSIKRWAPHDILLIFGQQLWLKLWFSVAMWPHWLSSILPQLLPWRRTGAVTLALSMLPCFHKSSATLNSKNISNEAFVIIAAGNARAMNRRQGINCKCNLRVISFVKQQTISIHSSSVEQIDFKHSILWNSL